MATANRRVRNNRKKGGNRRALVYLLLVVVLIVLIFYLLDRLKRPAPERPVAPPPPTVEKKEPAQVDDRKGETARIEEPPPVQRRYSAAVTAPPRHAARRERGKTVRPPVARGVLAGRGTVAIIVDDMGGSMQEVESLMAIDAPLTFAIIPGLARDREVAEAAHGRDHEVMVHMPMEPRDYPRRKLEKNGLLLAESDEEVRRQVGDYLRRIPHAVGANNHMGSRFTEDRGKMREVMDVLKGKGLFFIDSKTTPKSVGLSLAREAGIRSADRNVFLDNSQDVTAIRKQIVELANVARKRGSAIGICHPHKATIQALAAEMPVLKREGITFVYASQLVR